MEKKKRERERKKKERVGKRKRVEKGRRRKSLEVGERKVLPALPCSRRFSTLLFDANATLSVCVLRQPSVACIS